MVARGVKTLWSENTSLIRSDEIRSVDCCKDTTKEKNEIYNTLELIAYEIFIAITSVDPQTVYTNTDINVICSQLNTCTVHVQSLFNPSFYEVRQERECNVVGNIVFKKMRNKE